MNNDELREVVGKLEALEALTKLFNNLWFEQIRNDIKDEKVQAYLTVFADAFPHLNHVIEFVRRSASVFSDGGGNQEQWTQIQGEFDVLYRLLSNDFHEVSALSRAQMAPLEAGQPVDELSTETREALESVDQSDIDALFDTGNGGVVEELDDEETDEDLENLLDEVDEEELQEDDLLEDEEPAAEEDDDDGFAVGAEVSGDEMAALLADADEEAEIEPEDSSGEGEDEEAVGDGDDDESTSQDEIDALFG